MRPYPDTKRHNGVAAVLQFDANIDPDTSRWLSVRILEVADRIGGDSFPSEEEVTRAANALERRQISLDRDAVYAALFCALNEGALT